MGPNDFGCYYQVYKDREATRRVLTQFRKHHPNNPIYMVSDGGLDFSDIAKEFNCQYTHSWLNIGYWSHTRPEVIEYRASGGARGHCYGWNEEEALVYLYRFKTAIDMCRKPYMMLLEDDIIINSKISIYQDFDITYGGFNPYNFDALRSRLKWMTTRTNPTGWGMCGGNFIETNIFLQSYYNSIHTLICHYQNIQKAGLDGIGYMDTIMSVLLWLGGTSPLKEIINPLYSEHDTGATIFHDRSKRNSTKV